MLQIIYALIAAAVVMVLLGPIALWPLVEERLEGHDVRGA